MVSPKQSLKLSSTAESGEYAGVKAMSIIFLRFSAKKLSFCIKNQCYDAMFAKKSQYFGQKMRIFCQIFRRKYYKKS
jgi:hypothetical protein